MRHCYEYEGARRIVLGSGGSAFVDGGLGAMLQGMNIFTALSLEGEAFDKAHFKPHMVS